MNNNVLEKIETLSALELKPGDTLVVKLNEKLSEQSTERLHSFIRESLGLSKSIKLIVLDDGVDIGVIRQE